MDSRQLQLILAIADTGTFSKAAIKLGIAQPSLSQAVAKLEKEIGRPLFDRLPRRAVPTVAGELLLSHARRALLEISEAQRRLAESDAQPSGPLSIGVIPTIAPFLLPELIVRFTRRFPSVQFKLTEETTPRLMAAVESGELDMAIMSSATETAAVHLEMIATENLLLLLPKKHRLARRPRIAHVDIQAEPFILLHEVHCLAGQVAHVCKFGRSSPHVVSRNANLHTIAAMVAAGLGISVVPAMMCASAGKPRDVAFVPFIGQQPRRDICIATNILRYRTEALRVWMDMLREQVMRFRES